MTDPSPTTIIVMHADHVAALCTRDRVYLAEGVQAMPKTHPDRVFVETKSLVARAYLEPELIGTYSDQECDAAARILLDLDPTAADEFPSLSDRSPAPWWRRRHGG